MSGFVRAAKTPERTCAAKNCNGDVLTGAWAEGMPEPAWLCRVHAWEIMGEWFSAENKVHEDGKNLPEGEWGLIRAQQDKKLHAFLLKNRK